MRHGKIYFLSDGEENGVRIEKKSCPMNFAAKQEKLLGAEHGKRLSEMLKYIVSGEKPTTPNADAEGI